MEILVTIAYIVVCVLLFALAILIHEFGHFIVALRLGLKVDAFSIGFGPALWKKKVNGVEYRISSIPLGGYVSIPDIDPEGTKVLEGEKGAAAPVSHIPPWKEILVAFAGPFMNIVLAVVLAVVLSLVPGVRFGELPAVVGEVLKGGPAEAAGLQAGDRIVSVGGHEVATWTQMQTEILLSGGKTVEMVVERDTSVNGVQVHNPHVRLEVTPLRDEVTGVGYMMALSVTNEARSAAWMPDRSPWRQLAWDAGSIFRVLKGLVTPKEAKETAKAVSGPVTIAEALYKQVRRDTWDGIGFLRFLNVNLAVLNLLPIPVLDGGLILFALIALLFRRRLPGAVVKYVTLFFMVLLMGLMVFLIGRDSWRSYLLHTSARKPASAAQAETGDPKPEGTNETENATSQGR